MGKRVDNNTIISRLNNILEFKNEYTIDITSIAGSSKKAKFIHHKCPENHNDDFTFEMIVKDFISRSTLPEMCCQKKNTIKYKKIKTRIQQNKAFIQRYRSRKIYYKN